MSFSQYFVKNKEKRRTVISLKALGPIAYSMYKPLHSQSIVQVPIRIVRIYQDDWVCVHFIQEHYDFGKDGYWMVRGGVQWPEYLQKIIECYKHNRLTPQDFIYKRRLPEKLLEYVVRVANQDQSQLVGIFQKFRESDFLPILPKLTKTSCPRVFEWKTLRNHYQDFKS